MVKNIDQNNRSCWQCQECGFKYAEKEWAEKCEVWCREHKTCNVEITKQAIQEVSDKEKWIQKQAEREEKQKKMRQKKKIEKIIKIALIFSIVGAGIFGLGRYFSSGPPLPASETIARNGLHWHPEIKIMILGKNQEIPANIGLGITERSIHTHDNMGVIHLEFSGLVRKEDVRLSRFFENWGKQFNQNCILDSCNGPDGRLKMLVNGQESFEFENYAMKDGDKIEIIFE